MVSKTAKIRIVDDDPGHLATLKTTVRSWGVSRGGCFNRGGLAHHAGHYYPPRKDKI